MAVVGRDIAAAGWRQGSLLPADLGVEHSVWVHHRTQGLERPGRRQIEQLRRQGDEPDSPVLIHRPAKASERLIVLSHTCDLVKDPHDFPTVEVGRAFRTDANRTIAEGHNLGSARYYALAALDGNATLLLDFRWRAQLDKGLLVESGPDNSVVDGWDGDEAVRFARWLGRRYARPVLSDRDVAEVLDPVRERWKRLADEEPELHAAVSRAFIELRFRRVEGGLEVFALSPDEKPDEALALELFGILVETLEPHHGHVTTRSDKIAYDAFTRADDLTTEAIDLDWVSDGEIGGPQPPD